jgi:hypothetical protein
VVGVCIERRVREQHDGAEVGLSMVLFHRGPSTKIKYELANRSDKRKMCLDGDVSLNVKVTCCNQCDVYFWPV